MSARKESKVSFIVETVFKRTSGAIREAFPPLLTHRLLKESCKLESV